MPEVFSLARAEDISIIPKTVTKKTNGIDFVILMFFSFSF
jgi:hypothetical protein